MVDKIENQSIGFIDDEDFIKDEMQMNNSELIGEGGSKTSMPREKTLMDLETQYAIVNSHKKL